MEQNKRLRKIMVRPGNPEPKGATEAEQDRVDLWLDEQQWLTGFPAGTSETIIWSWWQPK